MNYSIFETMIMILGTYVDNIGDITSRTPPTTPKLY